MEASCSPPPNAPRAILPTLRLDNPVFTEPNPFNPEGKLQLSEVSAPFSVDLTEEGPSPRLKRQADGSVLVPAFTDLKRHKMGEVLDNEVVVQAGVPTDEWLTRKLWGSASEPPYLHHGRATLLSEAILAHGGEAQARPGCFAGFSADDQAAVVEFLKTLQVMPEGSESLELTAGEAGPDDTALWLAIAGGLMFAFVAVAGLVAISQRNRVARKAAP